MFLVCRLNRMLGFELPSPKFLEVERSTYEPATLQEWWDFKAVATASNVLLVNLPLMLQHWQGLSWAPETAAGYDALLALQSTLTTAMPYINEPVGTYDKSVGAKARKRWHIYALAIYPIVGRMLVEAGHVLPTTIHRNSVLTAIVRDALVRLNVPGMNLISPSGIAIYLSRWGEEYGMTTKHITALCAQSNRGGVVAM